MKKMLALLMVLVMTISVAACGKSTQNDAPAAGDGSDSQEEAKEEEKPAEDVGNNEAEYVIRYAFTSPQNSQVGKIAEGFKERVEELSGGRIVVEMYPDAQLGDKAANLESVRAGELEMCDASASDMSSYCPRWSVFSFPYMFDNSREMLDVVRNEAVFEKLDADTVAAGFKIVTFADFGSRNVFANKAIDRKSVV